jgi:hypothetical protein
VWDDTEASDSPRRSTLVAVSRNKVQTISITLSPAQIDSVLRSAAQSQAPSIVAIVGRSVGAARGANGTRSGPLLVDFSDPRLSRSLLRGFSLLTCFDAENRPRGIVELAQELDMSPSTAHRYALTLVHIGLLERAPDTRKYSLPRLNPDKD